MATVGQLETQIRDLRHQLEQSNQKLRDMRREIDRINSVQYEKLRREYDRLLDQKVQQNAREYESELNRLRDEMVELDRKRVEETHKALEQAKKQQDRLLKQLEEKNRELENIIKRIQEREQRHEQTSSNLAAQMIDNAGREARRANGFPHEFFFPSQFAIIREHLDRASDLVSRHMYEAAFATADAARVEIELLLVKTKQKMDEWEELFALYRETIRRLKKSLDELTNITLNTEAGSFRMSPGEIDFWSQGLYSSLRKQITDAYRTIEEIDEAGIVGYLKRQSPMTLFMLNRTLSEAEQMEIRMEAVDRCVRSERRLSDARYVTGQTIMSILETFGYIPVKDPGFREKNGKEDPSDLYQIQYLHGGMDQLQIAVIPERRDGICTGVRCLVKWTVKSVPDPNIVNRISNTIRSRISGNLPDLPVQIVSNMNSGQVEALIGQVSQTPNPELLYETLRN